jgi:hypothetical protein
MRKILLCIAFIYISYISFANEINVLNSIYLNFNLKIENNSQSINNNKEDKNNINMVKLGYSFDYGKNVINMYIYLKPKKKVDTDSIKNFTKIEKVKISNTNFGSGDIFDFFNKNKDIKLIINNNIQIKKFVAAWGSDITRDVLAYNFELQNNPIFDSCIIEFYDVWPSEDKLPNNLNVKYLDNEIKKGNNKIELYKIIDEVITNIKFNTNEKNEILKNKYFITSIPNLRLRDSIGNDGKILRLLNQGEKIEVLEKGKEETISGVKGNWVKVKTEKGEVGWCFSAYLEEVK